MRAPDMAITPGSGASSFHRQQRFFICEARFAQDAADREQMYMQIEITGQPCGKFYECCVRKRLNTCDKDIGHSSQFALSERSTTFGRSN